MTDTDYNGLIFICGIAIALVPILKDPWKRAPRTNGRPLIAGTPTGSFYIVLIFVVVGFFLGREKDNKDEEEKNLVQIKTDIRHTQDSTILHTIYDEVKAKGFTVDTTTGRITKIENSYNNSSNNKNSNNSNSNNNNQNSNNSNSSTIGPVTYDGPVGLSVVGPGNQVIGNQISMFDPTQFLTPDQKLSRYTLDIMKYRLPVLSKSEKSDILNIMDSLVSAKRVGKNVMVSISDSSNGILCYYQIIELLDDHGYKVDSTRSWHLFRPYSQNRFTWNFLNNRMEIIVGKFPPERPLK